MSGLETNMKWMGLFSSSPLGVESKLMGGRPGLIRLDSIGEQPTEDDRTFVNNTKARKMTHWQNVGVFNQFSKQTPVKASPYIFSATNSQINNCDIPDKTSQNNNLLKRPLSKLYGDMANVCGWTPKKALKTENSPILCKMAKMESTEHVFSNPIDEIQNNMTKLHIASGLTSICASAKYYTMEVGNFPSITTMKKTPNWCEIKLNADTQSHTESKVNTNLNTLSTISNIKSHTESKVNTNSSTLFTISNINCGIEKSSTELNNAIKTGDNSIYENSSSAITKCVNSTIINSKEHFCDHTTRLNDSSVRDKSLMVQIECQNQRTTKMQMKISDQRTNSRKHNCNQSNINNPNQTVDTSRKQVDLGISIKKKKKTRPSCKKRRRYHMQKETSNISVLLGCWNSSEKPKSSTKSVPTSMCESIREDNKFSFFISGADLTDSSASDDEGWCEDKEDEDVWNSFMSSSLNPFNLQVVVNLSPSNSTTIEPEPEAMLSPGEVAARKLVHDANTRWCEQYCRVTDVEHQSAKVQFSEDLVDSVVDCLPAEEYTRKGPWEEIGRDRQRFNKRIQETASSIAYCLYPSHRAKVFQKLYS